MSNSSPGSEFDVFKGLVALSESSFPKRCGNCGRIFETTEQYLSETQNLASGPGLKATADDDETPILEVFRNCPCGSTLMDFFSDRRDLSERGIRRRELFAKVLGCLEERGVPVHLGRVELLKFMRTGESELLKKLGIEGRIFKI